MSEGSELDDLRPDVDPWAVAHGFSPADRVLQGETPLLRLGLMDTTASAYEGSVGGRPALLAEFTIGTPGVTDLIGGTGVDHAWFTLFLVDMDASAWPRLTVHPASFRDGDWLARLLRRDGRRVHGIGGEFDRLYHVRADETIDQSRLDALFTAEFVAWLSEHEELLFDVEQHESGGHLLVARRGIGIGDAALDELLAATGHVAGRLDSAVSG